MHKTKKRGLLCRVPPFVQVSLPVASGSWVWPSPPRHISISPNISVSQPGQARPGPVRSKAMRAISERAKMTQARNPVSSIRSSYKNTTLQPVPQISDKRSRPSKVLPLVSKINRFVKKQLTSSLPGLYVKKENNNNNNVER